METLKEKAINAISKLPKSADIDDIMYRLYVIDKIKKGKDAAQDGKTISVKNLNMNKTGKKILNRGNLDRSSKKKI